LSSISDQVAYRVQVDELSPRCLCPHRLPSFADRS